MSVSPPYQRFVGVDVAARTATVVVQGPGAPAPARPFVIDQTPGGIATLQRQLQQAQIAPAATLVVLEATESYWITLATTLHHVGYAVSVINPTQTHHWRCSDAAKPTRVMHRRSPSSRRPCSPPPGRRRHPSITNFNNAAPNGTPGSACGSRSAISGMPSRSSRWWLPPS